ncbi:E3 ubiquitin/ISG15 ligase TRIM25-like [Pyxicephalus adspersus]|uniref:E3 ubiquitin/ISG15 ligase TRIM25-like n=1 Tax=Pyxicephalus adspersus TaxID=30357 RepID=UPI003B5A9715
MASANLSQELDHSICLNICTNPLNLRFGHNDSTDCVPDTQVESGSYPCPECRKKFQVQPANIILPNVVEHFQSTRIFCTFCIHSPVPAVMSCLLCEASLCDNHLRVHSKSPEHVLTEPTTSMEKRKWSIHKEILEYFCPADAPCICVSCSLDGDHQGHKVEMLHEASEKKKQNVINVLWKLIAEKEEIQKRVQSLQECRRKVQEKASDEKEEVTNVFKDLRRQLEDLEKRVMSEISRQEEQLSLTMSDVIQQLEIKNDQLSRKMGHIEELCNMTDPLTVLQESHTWDLCDTEDGDNEDRARHDELLHDGRSLDVAEISHTLHTGLSDMIKEVNACLNIQQAADILLDGNTAHNYLQISDDMKTASWSDIKQNRRETPKRFQNFIQVISCNRFFSGQHYWEVDLSESQRWIIGMCYPSIDRRGNRSRIGRNDKSWGLYRNINQCSVVDNSKVNHLPVNITSNIVRVYLDYEAGQLSFYDLSDPIRHLYTYTTSFTEPLHAALWLGKGCIKMRRGSE